MSAAGIGLLLAVGLVGMGAQPLLAQYTYLEEEADYEPKKVSLAFGFNIHTHGLGFYLTNTLKLNRLDKFRLVNTLDVGNLKDRREHRLESPYGQFGSSYIYDKQNYVYTLGLSSGLQRTLLGASPHSRFSLTTGVTAGLNLAFVKPYYLVVLDANNVGAPLEQTTFDPQEHEYIEIVGQGDFFEGFNQLTVMPGFKLKAFMELNLTGRAVQIRAIQAGVMADLFFEPVPLMTTQENSSLFFSAYLGFMIGGSWNPPGAGLED